MLLDPNGKGDDQQAQDEFLVQFQVYLLLHLLHLSYDDCDSRTDGGGGDGEVDKTRYAVVETVWIIISSLFLKRGLSLENDDDYDGNGWMEWGIAVIDTF